MGIDLTNFSGFMEEKLYGENGFYTTGGGSGRDRDFLTSPEVGDLFGKIIAAYIDSWFEDLQYDTAVVIEAGCGPGTLAASIARAELKNAESIEYICVERSDAHRKTTEAKLRKSSPEFSWSVVESLPVCKVPVLVIANELLDNLIFDIVTTETYAQYEPDRIDIFPDIMARYGIFGNIDNASLADVPRDIGDFKIPLHIGIAHWLDELTHVTSSVPDLSVLLFDYIKPVEAFEDGNWLRLYNDNKRIVGVESVLNALEQGVKGDITTDVISQDLFSLLDSRGFSKLKLETQCEWLKKQGIENYSNHEQASGVDQLEAFVKNNKISEQSYAKEIKILTDTNGLGAFGVATAQRAI